MKVKVLRVSIGVEQSLCGRYSMSLRNSMIKVEKSVYEPRQSTDGKRILVMTLWPRGVSKDKVDVWMKELGTPRELIGRFMSGEVPWDEFVDEYRNCLKG